MNSMTTCIFLMVLLASCIENGLALKCYTCASPEDSICGRNFNPSKVSLLDCVDVNNVCVRAKATVAGVTVVTRLCGTNESCTLFESCYTCTTDKCNSSTSVQLQFLLLLFAAFVFITSYV